VLFRSVYQKAADADGYNYFLTIKLTEKAGVATTLTGVTEDGAAKPPADYFSTTAIAAGGSISAAVRYKIASAPLVRTYGFSGQDANGFQWNQEIRVQFYGPAYWTYVSGISNAASGTAKYAPGMILSVYGDMLAPSSSVAGVVPLPLSLNGVSATVNGVAAPLYFVSPSQMNLQVPYETNPGTAVLEVNNAGNKYSYSFTVTAAAPGIFTDAKGYVLPYSGGKRGETLTLFITGEGAVTPAVATGTTPAATTALDQLPAPAQPVKVTIGGVAATVVFAGIPPGLVGSTQINFTVPDTAPLGTQGLVVTVGGVASATAGLIVSQ
jgi:uncharacterized protein (TIGR03437 family)